MVVMDRFFVCGSGAKGHGREAEIAIGVLGIRETNLADCGDRVGRVFLEGGDIILVRGRMMNVAQFDAVADRVADFLEIGFA